MFHVIYHEAMRSGKPIFCIVDDTIASHTKPSSQAEHPIEAAYFHQSHLKRCRDYGHQAVAVLLSCNGIVLNYVILLYMEVSFSWWHFIELINRYPDVDFYLFYTPYSICYWDKQVLQGTLMQQTEAERVATEMFLLSSLALKRGRISKEVTFSVGITPWISCSCAQEATLQKVSKTSSKRLDFIVFSKCLRNKFY